MSEAGMNQADVIHSAAQHDKKLGKSQVSQYVSGKTTPRRDVMELLARILDVDAAWLSGNTQTRPAQMHSPTRAPERLETASSTKLNQNNSTTTGQTSVCETPAPEQTPRSATMREFKKSSKLDNVLYDVRGPVVDEAARLEKEGQRILKLNIGNPAPFGFRTPDEVIQDMRHQLPECEGYSDSRGLFSARKAIMQYAQLKHIPNVDMDGIYTGNGVSELIQLCMQALLDNGDEILIPAPDYPLWTATATLAGGKVVHYICDEESDWNPDIADIRSKITDKTKAIVIINPNNPTGALYSKEILEEIVKVAEEFGLIIFSDEIYDRLVMDGLKHISIASIAPKNVFCVTFSGLSKSHMIAGFRVGWMVLSGNKKAAAGYIEGIKMLSNMRLCSNVPAQSIIQTALGGYQSVEEYLQPGGRIYEQREVIYKLLNDIPGVSAKKPKAAFYIFPKLDVEKFNIYDDEKFALDLLREKRILIVHGGGFNWGQPDHFRVVYLPRIADLEKATKKLGEFLDGYHQK